MAQQPPHPTASHYVLAPGEADRYMAKTWKGDYDGKTEKAEALKEWAKV